MKHSKKSLEVNKIFNKKTIILIVLNIILWSGFLWLSYVGIYWRIGRSQLTVPFDTTVIKFGPIAPGATTKYVALGDSLTSGVGSDTMESTIVYQYIEALANAHVSVESVNLAWPGDETRQVLKNQLPQAIKENPNVVTLFIGINDIHNKRSAAEFRQNYKEILDSLLKYTKAKIVVINLPYLGANNSVVFPFNVILNYRTRQFNDIISSLVHNERIQYVDLYSATIKDFNKDPKNYARDLFHPSGDGYLVWSRVINAN